MNPIAYSKVNLKEDDFKKMMINPLLENVYQNTILTEYPEFTPQAPPYDVQKVIRYAALISDEKSPVRFKTSDPPKQRIIAAELAMFPKNDKNEFTKIYSEILLSHIFSANIIVITMLFILNKQDVLTLTAFEESKRIMANKLLNENTTPATIKNIVGNIKAISDSINEIKKRLITPPNDEILTMDLFTFTQSKRLDISPEDYANMNQAPNNTIKHLFPVKTTLVKSNA